MNTKRKKVANLLWIVGVLVIFQTAAGPVVSARPTALAAAPTVRQIASSPALPGVLLASFVGTNEVRYSRSRGINWELVGNTAWSADGIDPVRVAVTPRSSTEPLTRFLVAPTKVVQGGFITPDTVYRSGDWGRTWVNMKVVEPFAPLLNDPMQALQLVSTISDPQVIYFVSSWYEWDVFVISVHVAQAYASLDAGVSWSNMNTSELGYPTWVIPSPRTPRKVYVSFFDNTGLWYTSEDAGQTWSGQIESPGGVFAIDPSSENILYAPDRYSVNGGQNWQLYQTNPCKSIMEWAVMADPKVSGILYLRCDNTWWRSQNQGTLWTELSLPGVQYLDADWGTPGRILAARGDGLWGSDDHGSTWFLLTPDFGSLPEHQFLPSVIH